MNTRAFFRVRMGLTEVRATRLDGGRARRFSVRLVDLSGSGAAILSTVALAVEEQRVWLHLPAEAREPALDAASRVVWCEPVHHAWKVGLAFDEMAQINRDSVVRRVFSREREQAAHRVPPPLPTA